MYLADLLRVHDAHGHGLAGNLGDGYLLANNRTFAAMRRAAYSVGITFDADYALTRDYACWSFFALPKMVAKRVVPYQDNVSPLRRLIEECPDFEIEPEIIRRTLLPNPILHETAHLISGATFETLEAHSWTRLSEAFISEAFSIACQTISTRDYIERYPEALFGDLNGIPSSATLREHLVECEEALGTSRLLALLLVGGFLAQFGAPKEAADGLLHRMELQGDRHVESLLNVAAGNSQFFAADLQAAYFRRLVLEQEFRTATQEPIRFCVATGGYVAMRIGELCSIFARHHV